jgi:hypothetical protein
MLGINSRPCAGQVSTLPLSYIPSLWIHNFHLAYSLHHFLSQDHKMFTVIQPSHSYSKEKAIKRERNKKERVNHAQMRSLREILCKSHPKISAYISLLSSPLYSMLHTEAKAILCLLHCNSPTLRIQFRP